MVQITALAVAAMFCSVVVRRGTPEFSLLIALGAGAGIILLSIDALESVLGTIRHMAAIAQLGDEVLRPVIKTVALSLLSKITGDLCRSAGEGGIAAFVETMGTIMALAVALPLAEGVLELMAQLLT